MLPELILREEKQENLPILALLGFLSGLAGFLAAEFLFPTQVDLLAVIFASIPLIFPLTEYFLRREKEEKPHLPEVKAYGSVFLGEVAAFFLLGLYSPGAFELQNQVIGASGNAVMGATFLSVLSNNMMVFLGIITVSAVIGSAGSFILTWNASVLGVFFSGLVTHSPLEPIAYMPHASLEMAGFIVAGISGTMISAAAYREHWDRETWLDLLKLSISGLLLIIVAAVLETA